MAKKKKQNKILLYIGSALAEVGLLFLSTLFGVFVGLNTYNPVDKSFWLLSVLIVIAIGAKVALDYQIDKN